ncbi:hypothetical protein GCM10007854_22690 [Algimonas porphyrae]|uniref:Uncharacterized protein n=1 Tax=Algimonas porphyrae TaxID=1128113 RepID=A0ABQ5V3K9_9PROT|nr:hypothetical protein GCM10007854_22690 [Algimonas porphyrae]
MLGSTSKSAACWEPKEDEAVELGVYAGEMPGSDNWADATPWDMDSVAKRLAENLLNQAERSLDGLIELQTDSRDAMRFMLSPALPLARR